jgi:hypothetical protein
MTEGRRQFRDRKAKSVLQAKKLFVAPGLPQSP